MSRVSQSIDNDGIATLLARLVQGVGNLVTNHLALARIEIGDDVHAIGARLGTMALFLPLVLVGYGLVCGALAVFLGRWLTLAGALLAVGGANLVAGGIGLKVASAHLMRPGKVEALVDGVKAQALASVRSTESSIDRQLGDQR